jgi:hypothetical protein
MPDLRSRRQKVIGQISGHHPGSEYHQNPTQNPTICFAPYDL